MSVKISLGTMAFHSLAVFLLIVCIFVSGPPVETCHKSCSCNPVDKYQDPTIEVQCGEGNLTKVPNMTFHEPVTILNVSFNALYTFEKETFSPYKSVKKLYLQHCKLCIISDEAFRCLEKLIFVDLSYNLFISISPNLFIDNRHLNELILRGNKLIDLKWNATLLNGPSQLSKLHLQSCKLKKLSSKTFSLLHNLQYLDISNNELEIMNYDTLSSLEELKDVKLENNPWKCGEHFYDLLRWIKCKKAIPHNRTLKCRQKNRRKEVWTPAKQLTLCFLSTTPSANSSPKTDMYISWTPNTTMIWSTTSDVSPNTTVSPTTKFDEQTNTTGERASNTSDVSPNTTVSPRTKFEEQTNTTGERASNTSGVSPNTTVSPRTKFEEQTNTTGERASNTSDVSPNTTLNPTTQIKDEADTNGMSPLTVFLIVVIVILSVIVIYLILVRRPRHYLPVPHQPRRVEEAQL